MGAATAILFPGQGSQTPDMRDPVARVRPDLLELAVEAVGEDPFARAEEGTNFAQPAIFCASLAGWEALGRPTEAFMAGHSLGELAALVAAGALDERDGLELVALRGRLMHESGERRGDGGMLALLGAGAADHAARARRGPRPGGGQRQLAPAGRPLRRARRACPAPGARQGARAARDGADVTGAFHSPMMAGAVPEFERALADVTFSEPASAPRSSRPSPPSRSTIRAASSPTR